MLILCKAVPGDVAFQKGRRPGGRHFYEAGRRTTKLVVDGLAARRVIRERILQGSWLKDRMLCGLRQRGRAGKQARGVGVVRFIAIACDPDEASIPLAPVAGGSNSTSQPTHNVAHRTLPTTLAQSDTPNPPSDTITFVMPSHWCCIAVVRAMVWQSN